MQQQQQQPGGGASSGGGLAALPEPLLAQVLLQQAGACSASQRHLLGVVSAVCRAWREVVAESTTAAAVALRSDAAAAAFSAWLRRHGTRLRELQITAAGLYGRHISAERQLALFQALAQAAGVQLPEEQQQQQVGGSSDDDSAEDGSGEDADGGAGPPLQQQQHQAASQQAPPLVPLQLTRLVASLRLTPGDCAAIAALPAPALASLVVHGSRTRRLTFDGVHRLAQLTQLRCLQLQTLRLGDEAVALLAQRLPALTSLSLAGNNIGPAGATSIAEHQTGLQQLDLSTNRIRDAGLLALTCSLPALQQLSLSGNVAFSSAALASLCRLTALTALSVGSCGLNNVALAALAAAAPGLRDLDAASNRVSKAEPLGACCSGLTRLLLSRNPLGAGAGAALAGLGALRELQLFEALKPKGVAGLGAHLGGRLSALALGLDPGLHPEGPAPGTGLLGKTRACGALFAALGGGGGGGGGGGALAVLSAPCCGFGNAQARTLAPLGGALTALNLSYNCISASGLRDVLAALPLLARLELRAMRPELGDDAAAALGRCGSSGGTSGGLGGGASGGASGGGRLLLLDLAYNDVSSAGVRDLGSGGLARLQHLNLRANVQVERDAVIQAATGLQALTHLNLLEVSDVTNVINSSGGSSRHARGGAGGSGSAGGGGAANAELWRALPQLQELLVGEYQGSNTLSSGRVMLSGG